MLGVPVPSTYTRGYYSGSQGSWIVLLLEKLPAGVDFHRFRRFEALRALLRVFKYHKSIQEVKISPRNKFGAIPVRKTEKNGENRSKSTRGRQNPLLSKVDFPLKI